MNPHTLQKSTAAIAVLSTALFLGGCVTTAVKPINPQARELYDASHQAMLTQGVALLTDACLYRLEVGTSHIYRDRSTQYAADLSEAIATKLATQNVPVKARLNPFVCAEMDAEYLKGLQQTAHPGGRLSPIDTHPLKSGAGTLSATEEAALLALMNAVKGVKPTKDRDLELAVTPTALALSAEQAETLRQVAKSPYVWVINQTEQSVSMGRKLGTAALTAGLTAGLSGGTYASWSTNEDAAASALALVNLETREVIWKRRAVAVQRDIVDFSKPLRTPQQMHDWIDKIFFVPFYETPAP